MKNYKELLSELPSKSAVFAVGRFNPPNIGHELIIKVVRKLASQRKADHFVFVSSTNDAKKNPLDISKKMQYLGSMFPNTKFVPKELDAAASTLKKYKHITLVVPADSVEYYKKLLKKTKLDNVEFVTAGSKCPDEDDKLLKLASKGNFTSFKTGLPTTVRELDGKRLMNDVRSGMGLEPIKEQINLVKDDLREQYFRGEIFNEGDIVECEETVYKIIKRGSNHLLLQCEGGAKVSKWIQDVRTTERAFMENKIFEAEVKTSNTNTDASAKKAKAETEKATLAAEFAKEKEDLQMQQQRKQDALKNQLRNEDSPVVNPNSKYNIAKSIMSLSDFRKSSAHTAGEKEVEKKVEDGLVGNSHMGTDGHRHRKVKYHLGEDQVEEARMSAAVKLQRAFEREQQKSAASRQRAQELLNPKKEEPKKPVSEGNGYDDNRTGFAKKPREDDEGYGTPKFKAKSIMDRPHTVHIGGKPWKKFDNGHQAHAAANTLKSKGKDATAVAHFREETDEQQATRTLQLKRFKDQAKDSKLTESQYAGLEAEDKPGKKKTEMAGKQNSVKGDTVEGWKDEKKPSIVAEDLEFPEINEEEFTALVQADMDALTEEDFFEAYDDDELAIIDDETGEELEVVAEESGMDTPALMEVLSRHERLMAKARFRRTQQHRKVKERIALKRLSTPEVANKRARRMAVSSMKKRLLQGRNPQKVSIGEKERVERFVQQRRKIVDRLAARMVQRVRQVEKARLHHTKYTKPNNGVKF